MRWALIIVGLLSVVATAGLRPQAVLNPLGHANAISLEFSKGDRQDRGDTSGWRPCLEIQEPGDELGVVCEGLRQIQVHGGRYVDVNYFCEFRFKRTKRGLYRQEYALCQ